jgi:hypothetical protein
MARKTPKSVRYDICWVDEVRRLTRKTPQNKAFSGVLVGAAESLQPMFWRDGRDSNPRYRFAPQAPNHASTRSTDQSPATPASGVSGDQEAPIASRGCSYTCSLPSRSQKKSRSAIQGKALTAMHRPAVMIFPPPSPNARPKQTTLPFEPMAPGSEHSQPRAFARRQNGQDRACDTSGS